MRYSAENTHPLKFVISAPSEALKYGGRRGDNKRLHDDVRRYLESQTEDTELQHMAPGFVAELRLSPIVACRLCLGRIWRQPEFTLTFHKITPGEGAGARFEQLDSH